jgi:hypothetical protein
MYGELHPIQSPTLEGDGWSSLRSGHLVPRKTSVTSVQWAGWASVSVCTVRKILPPPGFDPWTVQASDSLYRLRLPGLPLFISMNIRSYECSLIINSLALC